MRAQNAPQDAPASILIVHHNRSGLIARKTILEEQGYRVTAAQSPDEALTQFTGCQFDLVITDYRMPRMNGIEMIAKMRELRCHVPIILISSMVDPLGLTEDNTGADIVIAKSNLEVSHLTRAVGRLLRRKVNKKPVRSQTSATAAKKRKSG